MAVGSGDNPIGGGPIGGGPIGPWPSDAGGTTFMKTITANVTALPSFTKQVGKILAPGCDAAITIPRDIAFTRTINVDVLPVVVKAVSVTLTSALADAASTITKQAGKIITASGEGAVGAFSFMVGKQLAPACDAAITIPRDITFTRAINVDVSAPLTKAVSVTLVSAFAEASAAVVKQAGKIVLAGCDGAVAAFSFVVGKIVTAVCDGSVSVVKQASKTLSAVCDISAVWTTIKGYTRRIVNMLYY